MQDLDQDKTYSIEYAEYKIKVDDILKIDVKSDNPSVANAFVPNSSAQNLATNRESLIFNGYQVGSDGSINFPTFDKIYVLGMTIDELRNYIHKRIKNEGYLINSSVDVKILNSHFTILGEVIKPGKYQFVENNLNILEAIGMAGDLTINGERKNVKLIRENNDGIKRVHSIDLTKSSILMNNNFQIFSGDIIIVNPNSSRIKNAGIIGNSGTLVSLLSFLLSSIILITNN